MDGNGGFTLTLEGDREIVITREFDAPRELVFRAMSGCEHLRRWLGPRFLKMVHCEMDFRPGGHYRYVHRAPDGSEYGFRGEIREIFAPERVVQTFEFDGMPGHVSVETMTLEDVDGRTRLTTRSLFASREDRDGMAQSGMEVGVRDSYDRLQELVELLEAQATGPEFVHIREFDAPRELVYRAFTEVDRLEKWWGPVGMPLAECSLDLRPGGIFHYCMQASNGNRMWGRWVIRELDAPERIVWVNSFSDEAGGLTRHPMAAGWPLEMLCVVTLTELSGRTVLTLRSMPLHATESERYTFRSGFASMEKGYGGTMDQLRDYLAGS